MVLKRGKTSGMPVLMYHALTDNGHPPRSDDKGEQLYVLHVDQFRRQMAHLHHAGFTTMLLKDIPELGIVSNKSVIITFDDGDETNYTLAFPVLLNYGFKAEFFVTTDWIDTPHFLTSRQIREMHDGGMEIGSHGATHSFMDDLDEQSAERELRASRDVLEEITGTHVVSCSAPGGRINRTIEKIAKKIGYKFLCTSRFAFLEPKYGSRSIPRLAIRKSMEQQEFSALISGAPNIIHRYARRAWMLDFVKKMTGNRLYDNIRAVMLKSSGQ